MFFTTVTGQAALFTILSLALPNIKIILYVHGEVSEKNELLKIGFGLMVEYMVFSIIC